ncbi:glycosyltransferase family 4 protein [Clostridium disporicum]|uniref:Glycosyltransferase n=1 Tax=Clostridium disporicum TaxID=84024 RepID=A0A174FD81_9CLOT|nr:glycosyltransferase family 4 protein [Clostridium disporicum]CUO46300.1 glycosyltransferase [Clostridium disporicum]
MKVCFFAHSANLTGASRSLIDLLTVCKEVDVEPYAIIPKKGLIEEELKKNKIQYKVIPYCTMVKKSTFKNILKKCINSISLLLIGKYVRDNKIDIIHNNSSLIDIGMKVAKRNNIPYLCHIRDFGGEDHKIDFINPEELYKYIEEADKSIAISDSVFNKYSNLIPKAKMVKVYNGVNLNNYDIGQRDFSSKSVTNILISGRICEGKGQFEAIKAIEYLINHNIKDIKLYVVGEGIKGEKYYDELREYVLEKKLESNIVFLPFMKDLREIREKCDIALVCSVSEAFGRVTIESMLSKQLVIGANTAATAELIEDRVNGLLYNQGDYISLANSIIFALENKIECEEISNNGYNFAKDGFSIQRTMKEIKNEYIKILKK